MKALLLDGAHAGDKTLESARMILSDKLRAKGWTVEGVTLRDTKIAQCIGCFGCWVKTPGKCFMNDTGNDIARSIVQSDLLLLLTPITFGGYSSELKKALDRVICIVLPFFARIRGEVHHKPRYQRYPALVAIGGLPAVDEECEGIFRSLVSRNAVNFFSPLHEVEMVYDWQTPDDIMMTLKPVVERRSGNVAG
ncbi:MAG: flavodoxin family protein [Thermodesulfovibrionales bacterium]